MSGAFVIWTESSNTCRQLKVTSSASSIFIDEFFRADTIADSLALHFPQPASIRHTYISAVSRPNSRIHTCISREPVMPHVGSTSVLAATDSRFPHYGKYPLQFLLQLS